ncbi:MAG: signal peptidase II [Rhodospirillales bacterium]
MSHAPSALSRTAGAAIAVLVLALDQASKWWIVEFVMDPPRVIPVTPFFNLVLAWNRGVSFGMFAADSAWGPWLLTALACVIVIALAVWLWRTPSKLSVAALGLIIGGAIGNVIDRLQYGAVIDFLDVHAAGWHWPAFNVADSAICVGAAILVLESLFTRDETS